MPTRRLVTSSVLSSLGLVGRTIRRVDLSILHQGSIEGNSHINNINNPYFSIWGGHATPKAITKAPSSKWSCHRVIAFGTFWDKVHDSFAKPRGWTWVPFQSFQSWAGKEDRLSTSPPVGPRWARGSQLLGMRLERPMCACIIDQNAHRAR